jgi:hypothetical protein
MTWKTVTTATPRCNTFAVIHISAMPPGVVPNTIVGISIPDNLETTPAKINDSKRDKIV